MHMKNRILITGSNSRVILLSLLHGGAWQVHKGPPQKSFPALLQSAQPWETRLALTRSLKLTEKAGSPTANGLVAATA